MAANNELQTSRIIGSGAGSSIDDAFRNVEAALRTIFKVTADSDCQEAMQIGVGPNATMTGTLTLAADPTENLHACTKQYVDNNVSAVASIRCSLVLSSGQTITDGSTDALDWDAAHIEAGGDCWAIGDPTKLIFPSAGDYLITGCIQGDGDSADPEFTVKMKHNGSAWLYTNLGYGHNEQAGAVNAGVPFAVMEPMSTDDYIEIFVYVNGSDHDMTVDCYLSMMLVGG